MPLRPRVLLLIPHLGGGGAERVIQVLANSLDSERYDLHLGLTASAQETLPTHAILPHVTVHTFFRRRVRYALPSLLRLVWRIRPDLVLSGIAHLNLLVLASRPLFPRSTRIIVRQNGTLSSILSQMPHPALLRTLYRNLYPRADRIICQSDPMALDLLGEIPLRPSMIAVLPNPVDLLAIQRELSTPIRDSPGPGPHLLAVGRLSLEKGFDILLEALNQIRPDFPSIRLVILGKGSEEANLKLRAAHLGLDYAVQFAGYVDSPASYFPAATVFVLPSRHEGVPNALLEAAAAGLPIIATPASEGLVELVRGAPGVWLTRNATAQDLAETIRNALLALRPPARFSHAWTRPFLLPNAVPAYEQLLDDVLLENKNAEHRYSSSKH